MDDDTAIPSQPAAPPSSGTFSGPSSGPSSDRPSQPDAVGWPEAVEAPASAAQPDAAGWPEAAEAPATAAEPDAAEAARDIAEVPAIELISTAALHLMSAAAVKCGLGHDEPGADDPDGTSHVDLDEARKLITALAGLVTAAAPEVGNQHARLLRDGLRQVQLAFREASPVPDPPGQGPGERLTGPVS